MSTESLPTGHIEDRFALTEPGELHDVSFEEGLKVILALHQISLNMNEGGEISKDNPLYSKGFTKYVIIWDGAGKVPVVLTNDKELDSHMLVAFYDRGDDGDNMNLLAITEFDLAARQVVDDATYLALYWLRFIDPEGSETRLGATMDISISDTEDPTTRSKRVAAEFPIDNYDNLPITATFPQQFNKDPARAYVYIADSEPTENQPV
jgi:hypothetical protein